MVRRKLNRLLPVGIMLLASGLILHNFVHVRYGEASAGFLIGMSAVFIIASCVEKMRTVDR